MKDEYREDHFKSYTNTIFEIHKFFYIKYQQNIKHTYVTVLGTYRNDKSFKAKNKVEKTSCQTYKEKCFIYRLTIFCHKYFTLSSFTGKSFQHVLLYSFPYRRRKYFPMYFIKCSFESILTVWSQCMLCGLLRYFGLKVIVVFHIPNA